MLGHREACPCENPLFPVTLEGEQEVSRDQACDSSMSSWAAWIQSLSLWEPKFPLLQSESCWWEAGRMDTCACMAESLHRSPETVTCSLAVLQHTHTQCRWGTARFHQRGNPSSVTWLSVEIQLPCVFSWQRAGSRGFSHGFLDLECTRGHVTPGSCPAHHHPLHV